MGMRRKWLARPTNAWLIMGDESSIIDDEIMRYGTMWTCPKWVQPGDLAVVYWMAPQKQATHIARFESIARFDDPDVHEADLLAFGKQWWAEVGSFEEIVPVPFAQLREWHDGHLILKGQAGKYLRPEVVAQLVAHRGGETSTLQLTTGDPRLPASPTGMSVPEWNRLSAGALRQEKDVERYIVEPFLRWLKAESSGFEPRAQQPIGKKRADYGLVRDGDLLAVVEVKIAAKADDRDGAWSGKDIDQLRGYCDHAGVPGVLVDARQILVFVPGESQPVATYLRAGLGYRSIRKIGRHLGL